MKRVRSIWSGLVLAAALAACGGTPAASILFSPPSGGSTAAIAIVDNAFQGGDLTVAAGTTVTWTNQGQRKHTVTSEDGSFASDGSLSSGAKFEHRFDTAGTFRYVCAIHAVMHGTITVTP